MSSNEDKIRSRMQRIVIRTLIWVLENNPSKQELRYMIQSLEELTADELLSELKSSEK